MKSKITSTIFSSYGHFQALFIVYGVDTNKELSGKGRHKTASAVVTLKLSRELTALLKVNNTDGKSYFNRNAQYLRTCKRPLEVLAPGFENAVDIDVRVRGGGLTSQANAIKLGVANALLKLVPIVDDFVEDPDYGLTKENVRDLSSIRSTLKRAKCLTRDARCKERKKYGLQKARRAPQFSKR